jgi:phosphatidylglycerol:prolipoprotein diacylglycerol transferase
VERRRLTPPLRKRLNGLPSEPVPRYSERLMAPLSVLTTLASISWKVLDRFRVGSHFAISPHGVGIAVGFLAGSFVLGLEARKRGYPEEAVGTILFWALIGTIIGSRVAYVFTHLSEFTNVVSVLEIYKGGLSLIGGIVGAVIASYFVVRRLKLDFVAGLDSAAIGLPLGIVIGRVGDLIIGDHLGKPTSWFFAFKYAGGNLSGYDCTGTSCTTVLHGGRTQVITRAGATLYDSTFHAIAHGVGVHQTAFYDYFIAMGLVVFLVYLNRRPRRRGVLIATFALWYGTGRIITDFLRVENRFLGLTGSQWSSVAVVAVCLFVLVRMALRPSSRASDGGGGSEPQTVPDAEPVEAAPEA